MLDWINYPERSHVWHSVRATRGHVKVIFMAPLLKLIKRERTYCTLNKSSTNQGSRLKTLNATLDSTTLPSIPTGIWLFEHSCFRLVLGLILNSAIRFHLIGDEAPCTTHRNGGLASEQILRLLLLEGVNKTFIIGVELSSVILRDHFVSVLYIFMQGFLYYMTTVHRVKLSFIRVQQGSRVMCLLFAYTQRKQ